MNPYDSCTVDELIDLTSEAAPEVFARLSAITATARADGVEATVNLEGRLVGLRVAPSALAVGPDALAASVFRLTQEASAAALNSGIEVLAPLVGDELTGELRSLVLPAAAPEPARPPEDDFAPQTWAVQR